MDTAVPMMSKESDEIIRPLFYKRDTILTKIIVDKIDFGGKFFNIIFVGTRKFIEEFFDKKYFSVWFFL